MNVTQAFWHWNNATTQKKAPPRHFRLFCLTADNFDDSFEKERLDHSNSISTRCLLSPMKLEPFPVNKFAFLHELFTREVLKESKDNSFKEANEEFIWDNIASRHFNNPLSRV